MHLILKRAVNVTLPSQPASRTP